MPDGDVPGPREPREHQGLQQHDRLRDEERMATVDVVGHDAGATSTAWREWIARNPWDAWEKALMQTAASDLPAARPAAVAPCEPARRVPLSKELYG